MKWLDERLFGWSRSARRGTSVWAGGASSHGPSAVTSPEGSDDEENGDYEHVLGYLPGLGIGDGTRSVGRSRSTSYADLQSLRKGDGMQNLQALSPSSPTGDLRARSRSDANQTHLSPLHARRSGPNSPVRTTLALTSMPPLIHIPVGPESTTTASSASPTNTSYSYVMADPPSAGPRESPRLRRMSLNDGVNVQRIALASPVEPFDETTEGLNRENILNRRRQGHGDNEDNA